MANERILIADDDAAIRRLLKVNLRLAGFETDEAGSGAEAIEKVRLDPPDAIVLDLMMPTVDGWAVAAAIRGDLATAEVPIVLLSARAWGAERERGYALGVNEFLSKPFDPADLVAALQRVLGGEVE